MGSWGYGVMEGDVALDLDFSPEETEDFAEYALRLCMLADRMGLSVCVAVMVAAHNTMTDGRPLPAANRQTVRKAIKRDEWAKTCWQRRAALDDFTAAVLAYDGTPWESNQNKGLFETVLAAQAGKGREIKTVDGLRIINVGPEVDGLHGEGDES